MSADESTPRERAAARFVPRHLVAVQPLIEEVDEPTVKQRAAAWFRAEHGATPPTTILEKGSAKDRARLRFEPMAKHRDDPQHVILVTPPDDAA